jgi:signal peptidase I
MELTKSTGSTELKRIDYIGPSMKPTLKPGDRLRVSPYRSQQIRRGDVVVFVPPAGTANIIHRVIYAGSEGIKTRGDNCNQVDQWVLSPDCILGRVVCVRRRHRWLRVYGGSLGHLLGVTNRTINGIYQRVSGLLHPAYEWSAKTGMFRRLLPAQMTPRVISFARPEGTELQLLMGRWLIGRRLPGRSRWHIRRPFRLFVDENSLLENPTRQRL